MNKEAFYFPHFSNARNDRKVKRLRKELGAEGYGIYFMILETLRDEPDFSYPMQDIDLLASDFDVSEPKVRTVICNYSLFDVSKDEKFFSPKLIEYLEPYFRMRKQRQNAIKARWDKDKEIRELEENVDTTVLRPYNDHNTDVIQKKVKESKRKESKVNKNIKTDVDIVYDKYPTKCPTNSRTTSKNSNCKQKIKAMLKTISRDDMIKTIDWYVQDCAKTKTYIKNFDTFLNNFPDIPNETSLSNVVIPEKKEEWHSFKKPQGIQL
jgi:hypothetical protein